jgi:hypothetical protein
VKQLSASDGAASDGFGRSVAVSGDTIVVGAYQDDVGANANQGSAYVFQRNQGGADQWGQVKQLVASDGAVDDEFGVSVAVSGDTIVVGAYFDDVGANANQGSAYVFQRNQGGADQWGHVRQLTASDGAINDWFGGSVAMSGDTIAVGAYLDDVGANTNRGSAYVFRLVVLDPVLTLPGGALVYQENDAATVLDAGATVTDVDSADLDTGTLTVELTVNGSADDRLELRNEGTAAGQIGVSGADVTFAGTTIGTFAGGSGTTPLVVTLNASSTPAAAQALLRNVTYRNVSETPSTLARTVRVTLTDGDGGTSNQPTKTINVAAVNDAPALTLPGAAINTLNGVAPVLLDAGATAVDVDSADLDTGTLTVELTVNGHADDRLELRNEGTGAGQIGVAAGDVTFAGTTIGTFTGGSGTTPLVVTFNASCTPAAAQALLRNVTFRNVTVGIPSTAPRTARATLTDGDGGTSNQPTKTVNVSPSNVAPTVSGAVAGQAVEDASTISPFAQVTIDDGNGDTLTVEVQLDLAAKGAFTAASLSGSGFTDLGGGLYQRSATPGDATTAVRALVFDPANDRVAPGQTETTTFTLTARDGSLSASDATTTVVSTSKNDAPTVTGTRTITVQDTGTARPFARVTVTDPDQPPQTLSVTATFSPTLSGTVTAPGFTDAGNGAWTFTGTAAALTAALQALTFEPADAQAPLGSVVTTTASLAVSDGVTTTTNTGTTVRSTVTTAAGRRSSSSGCTLVVGRAAGSTPAPLLALVVLVLVALRRRAGVTHV